MTLLQAARRARKRNRLIGYMSDNGVAGEVIRLVERGVFHDNRLWVFPDEPRPIIIGDKRK